MNIQKMMKQAAKMQEELTASLATKTVDVTVGGGNVTVTANGLGDILAIKNSKQVVAPEAIDILEDLVLSGVKQAIATGKAMAQSEIHRLTPVLRLPPGML